MRTSEFLTISGAIVPDRDAVIFDDEHISFEGLQGRVNRLANALAEKGVGQGDRLAIMQVNGIHGIVLYFAAAKLDAIYVPINFRAKTEELEQMVSIAQPSMLFLGQRYVDLAPTSGEGALPPERIVILDGPAQGRMLSYEQLTYGSTEDELHFPEAEDNDTTVIMFTAGTTGVPKGVMLTHESFSSFLLATVNPADPDDEESNLLTVPLSHIG